MGRIKAYPDTVKDYIYDLQCSKSLSYEEIAKKTKEKFKGKVPGIAHLDAGRVNNVLYRIKREKKAEEESKIPKIPSLDTAAKVLGVSDHHKQPLTGKVRTYVYHEATKLRDLGYTWQSVREELQNQFPEYVIPSGTSIHYLMKTMEKKNNKKEAKPQRGEYIITIKNPQGKKTNFELQYKDALDVIDTILTKMKNKVIN